VKIGSKENVFLNGVGLLFLYTAKAYQAALDPYSTYLIFANCTVSISQASNYLFVSKNTK
jgi:hypothetical protein